MSQNLFLGIIGGLFLVNIISLYLLLRTHKDDEGYDKDFLRGEILLLNRTIESIKEEMIQLTNGIIELKELNESSDDEIQRYIKQGNDIGEIAKKMNRSVKEVELILKMRGNR